MIVIIGISSSKQLTKSEVGIGSKAQVVFADLSMRAWTSDSDRALNYVSGTISMGVVILTNSSTFTPAESTLALILSILLAKYFPMSFARTDLSG